MSCVGPSSRYVYMYVIFVERNKLASKVKREIIKVRRQMALQQGERLLSDDDLNATVDTVSDVDDDQPKTEPDSDVVVVKEESDVNEKPDVSATRTAKRKGGSTLKKKQAPPAKTREAASSAGRCTRRSLRLERTEHSDVIEIDDDDVLREDHKSEKTSKSESEQGVTPRRALTRARVRPTKNSAKSSAEPVEVKEEPTDATADTPADEEPTEDRTKSQSPPPTKRRRRHSTASETDEQKHETKQDEKDSEAAEDDNEASLSDVTRKDCASSADTAQPSTSDFKKQEEEKTRKRRISRGTPSPRKKSRSNTAGAIRLEISHITSSTVHVFH